MNEFSMYNFFLKLVDTINTPCIEKMQSPCNIVGSGHSRAMSWHELWTGDLFPIVSKVK